MNNRKYRNIPMQQQLYTLAYVVLSIKAFLDSSYLWRRPEIVDTLLLCTYFGLIFLKLFMQDYSWKKIVGMVVIGIPCVITCFHISYFTILFSFTLIIGMQYVDIKKTLNTVSNVKLFIIAIHVMIYIVVYFVAPETLRFSYRMGGSARHYFYIGHANTFSAYLVWSMLEKVYANYEKVLKRHIVFVWLVYFIFYQFTDSNTSLIACSVCCIFMFIDKMNYKKIEGIISFLARYSYAVFAAVFFFLIGGYTQFQGIMLDVFDELNDFFTGRLLFGAYLYDTFGSTMLGQSVYITGKVHWYGHWIDSIVLDNCYLMLIEYYGWFYMLVIALAFWIINRKNGCLGNIEKIFLFVYSFFAITENYATNIVLCFPLIMIGVSLYQTDHVIEPKDMKKEKVGHNVLTMDALNRILEEEIKKERGSKWR